MREAEENTQTHGMKPRGARLDGMETYSLSDDPQSLLHAWCVTLVRHKKFRLFYMNSTYAEHLGHAYPKNRASLYRNSAVAHIPVFPC